MGLPLSCPLRLKWQHSVGPAEPWVQASGPLFAPFKCPANLLPGEAVNGHAHPASFHRAPVAESLRFVSDAPTWRRPVPRVRWTLPRSAVPHSLRSHGTFVYLSSRRMCFFFSPFLEGFKSWVYKLYKDYWFNGWVGSLVKSMFLFFSFFLWLPLRFPFYHWFSTP